ncbi:MAG: acyl-CoA thioesterase [Prevotella sp.]|nr:acyl-CoA thioesterase [Prevotella sp.]
MKRNYVFQTSWPVRDYECDIEGIVNNAQYLHYCEHTRHLFLQQCGLSFAGLHRQGTDAVVAHMKLWYKVPLRPDDILLSCMNLQKTNAFKYTFRHDIYRQADERLCFRAEVELVCLVGGRLSASPVIDEAFRPYVQATGE